ncbi:right-handed parallel beta-helix repeat-containing protein [Alienimonas californiensis]|uniref:Probable pectate lyase C n=1 Tax=Alienimonas californiensis TaxID=2527989 RepID=A0A517P6I6_9PLAN|nr:right-handed parallel beta-helix repeat-containing protein [Alienimonas californiensis]QDT14990.1 hypothetical protein CA12_10700 [Alienimonas californiensis]
MRFHLVPVVVVVQGVLTVAAPAWGQAAGPALIAAPPRPLQTDAPAGGAGLFVGVNRFSDPSGAVSDLRYAVNDAVGLAHLFALELDLIPAKNCTLALSGEPDGERGQAELKALTAAGAQVTGATKSEILDGLFRACDAAAQAVGPAAGQAAGPAGAENAAARAPLVISLSSHGFDDAGTPFVMPSDGRRRRLGVTALPLSIVEDEAGRSRAGHRLLLVDACQERIGGTKAVGAAGTVAAMSPAFAAALAKPTGQVKIASCAAGQVSVEVPSLRHGVFTKAFLDCLRGAAGDRDGDGVISLGDVEPVMEARVKALIADYNQGLPEGRRIEQSPAFYGPLAARRLPLAVPATDVAALIAQLAAQTSPDGYPPVLHDRVAAALQGQADPRLHRAAEQFAAGGDAFTFRAVAEALLTGRKVVTVAADGSGDVRTVAEALAKVADDGRVRVLPGTYREEPLVIDRPVTLEGVGPREEIEIQCATGYPVWLTATGAVVRGLSLTCTAPARLNAEGEPVETFEAIYVTAGRPTIEDCFLRSEFGGGVGVQGAGAEPTVRNCVVEDAGLNGIHIADGAGGFYAGCVVRRAKGIGFAAAGAGTAPTVRNCSAEDGEGNGLVILDGAAGTYEGCVFKRHKGPSIAVAGAGTAPSLKNCSAEDGAHGLYIGGGAAGSYQDCAFTGDALASIFVEGAGTAPTLTNCSVVGGKDTGLLIHDGAAGVFEGCTFKDHQYAGVTLQDAGTRPTLRRCTIAGNGYQAIWVRAGAGATVENCDLSGNVRGPTFLDEGAGSLDITPSAMIPPAPGVFPPAPGGLPPAPPAPFDPPAPPAPPEFLDAPAPPASPEILDPPAPPAPPGGG